MVSAEEEKILVGVGGEKEPLQTASGEIRWKL